MRKIAAFAGAAVLGLSAVAVADVVYGNTQLVDQNGQPTVKIYVGSKAAISDGVAAANIAAKIANEAYKSSTLTATMSGTPTCTVGSGVSGAGTCSIVESSKKVTLSVTVPGTVAGAHTFKTLITDTIDRSLANRISTKEEDKYNSTTSSPDTSSVTTPLRAVASDPVSTNLYMIGSNQFTGFADTQVKDYQATGSGSTYTVQQSFWIGSQNDAVKYDSDSSIRDVAVNTYTAAAYSVKFAGNDF
ncbi:MAG: S-layer protein, partial [Candidatus Anstonellaceae archaeon]